MSANVSARAFKLLASLIFSIALTPSVFALSETLTSPPEKDIRTVTCVNLLARDYSVHPVLGTKAGEHYKGDLSAVDLDKLCCESIYWSVDVPFDPNYLAHEQAELDAAEQLCKLALAGKFNTYRPANLDPAYITDKKLTVGFNHIPLELTYRGFDCTKAVCGEAVQKLYKQELPNTGPYRSEILKHPILDTEEFKPLGASLLPGLKFKELNEDPGARDFYEHRYIGSSECFRKAEGAAASQFSDRVLGLTEMQILDLGGEPSIKTGPVIVWGDSDKCKKNWVYYFGYSGIPVRLVFDGNKCVGSALLSTAQQHAMFEFNIFRFSSRRPEEIACDPSRVNDMTVRQIAGFPCIQGNPEGKSRAEILETFGEPQSITKDSEGHPLYIYGTGRFAHVEIPIVDDHAYGRISHIIRIGWSKRN